MSKLEELKEELADVQRRIKSLNTTTRETISRQLQQVVGGEVTRQTIANDRFTQLDRQIQTLQQREFGLIDQIQNIQQTDQNGNQLNLAILSIPVILGAGVVIFLLVRRKK